MTTDFEIRPASIDDSEQISRLIITVAESQLRNEFSEEGWSLFLRLISRQTQQGLISDDQFNYWVAYTLDEQGDEIITGLLSSKNTTHIFHFFIHPHFQRQGIGRALWRNFLFQLPATSPHIITVKSSDFACDFYHKLGFVDKQPRCMVNGLVYTLMHYTMR